MTTILPTDANDNPIPALRLKDNKAHSISASTAGSARNTTAFDNDTRVVSVYADTAVYIRFGESDVVATTADHYFPGGLYYDFAIGGDGSDHTSYMAVRAADESVIVYVSEKS